QEVRETLSQSGNVLRRRPQTTDVGKIPAVDHGLITDEGELDVWIGQSCRCGRLLFCAEQHNHRLAPFPASAGLAAAECVAPRSGVGMRVTDHQAWGDAPIELIAFATRSCCSRRRRTGSRATVGS